MRFRRSVTAALLTLLSLAIAAVPAPAQAPEDKALGRPAIASSVEPARDGGPCSAVLCAAGMATDGRDDTRWGSAWVDKAWWRVDLGRPRLVNTVALDWHRARPLHYLIETSLDGKSFAVAATVNLDLSDAEIAAVTESRHYTETTPFGTRSARYVRVTSLDRAPIVLDGKTYFFGVSIWTASVFGPPDDAQSTSGNANVPVPASAPAPAPLPASPRAPVTGPAVVSGFMEPFPVVRIKGHLTANGARIELLSVTAPGDATIRVRCRGRSCPQRLRTRSGGRRRIRELHRKLAAGTVVTVRVTRPNAYGKYTRFAIRRGRPPARIDRCLRGSARRPVRCPAA